jgi:hypothetical protein
VSALGAEGAFLSPAPPHLDEFSRLAEEDPVLKLAGEGLDSLKIHNAPSLFEGIVIGFRLQEASFSSAVHVLDELVPKLGEQVK